MSRAALASRMLLLVAAVHTPAPAAAQNEPPWIHVSPLLGAVVGSVPGEAPRPAAGFQLEASGPLPIGIGVAAGHARGSAGRPAAESAGTWAEAILAYRFRLRFRGYIAPYAGPLLGGALHDLQAPDAPAGAGRWLARWHFGGRAGLDIPVGSGWPSVRVDVSYRHAPSAGGLPGSDLTTALVGFRWSRPLR